MLDHWSPMAEVKEESDARSRRVREIAVRNDSGSAIVPVCAIEMMNRRG